MQRTASWAHRQLFVLSQTQQREEARKGEQDESAPKEVDAFDLLLERFSLSCFTRNVVIDGRQTRNECDEEERDLEREGRAPAELVRDETSYRAS